jgi:glutamine synthetase
VRSLVEDGAGTRIELRTGGADANPYWLTAGVLAAVAVGIEDAAAPGGRGDGNLYQHGVALPASLDQAAHRALADERLRDVLGHDAVADYGRLALAEWKAYLGTVTEWERERYLKTV